MTNPAELEAKFWKALKSDMTMMLGIARADEAHTRPMTAQLDGDQGGPIWFFTAKDNDLVQQLRGSDRAVATFASKDHDVFAAVHGDLRIDTNRAVIDKLWNRYVAAWYEGGIDDPKLVLLGSTRIAAKSGLTHRVSSRASRCFSGSIQRRTTRTRSRRWTLIRTATEPRRRQQSFSRFRSGTSSGRAHNLVVSTQVGSFWG